MKQNYQHFRKIFIYFGLILFCLFFGTFGYMLVEKWSFLDAFYMTVITSTTVGFTEIKTLSDIGRIFTIVLIFISIGTIAYVVSSFTQFLLDGEYKETIQKIKFLKKMKKMKNHVIICGYGRVGKQVVDDLINQNIPVIIIDSNPNISEKIKQSELLLFINEDATLENSLEKAKIKEARALITCLPKDTDNLYVVLSACEFKNDLYIISRASNTLAISKLKNAGATNVIMPDVIGGTHIAALISNPDVIAFLDQIKAEGIEGVNIESIAFSELPENLKGKSIGELEVKQKTGVTIIGYKDPSGNYVVNPDESTKIIANSSLFVLGNPQQIKTFNQFYLS
jgi:voltage-gated potassium channel